MIVATRPFTVPPPLAVQRFPKAAFTFDGSPNYMNRLSCSLLLAAFSMVSFGFEAHAAPGDADPTFNNGAGYVTYAASYDAPWFVSGAIALADGSAILAGHANANVYVRHYFADGRLDTLFGNNGTATLGGFASGTPVFEYGPQVHVFEGANGTILIEQNGLVQRLSAGGQPDPTFHPQINVGLAVAPTLLPQSDGRFIVVGAQQGIQPSQDISVRYFLADGSPDTVRGDVNGERLVHPAGPDAYYAASAATQPDGKLLIAAHFSSSRLDSNLALIRLNVNGSYDTTFGLNGQVVIAEHVGAVAGPWVTVGSNGQIAYLIGVGPDQYFVVYVLRADGSVDTSVAGNGRISVPATYDQYNGSLAFASPPPRLAVRASNMLWQYDLGAGGPVPAARNSSIGLANDFREFGFAFGGDTLWVFGGEDRYDFGRLGMYTVYSTFGRGVAVPYRASTFGSETPPRISATFPASQREAFTDLQSQPDGGLLTLGTSSVQTTATVLTKFTAAGAVDSTYAAGAGRVEVPWEKVAFPTDAATVRMVKANDGSATLLTSRYRCVNNGGCTREGSLIRYLPTGVPDSGFGNAGVLMLPSFAGAGSEVFYDNYFPGFVDDDGTTTILRLSDTAGSVQRVQPLRYGRNGAPLAGFNGAAQSAVLASGPIKARLVKLPDGRLQATLVHSGGDFRLSVSTLRWLADGSVDPRLPNPSRIDLTIADLHGGASDLDVVVTPEGYSVVAIWQASQRIILRLDPNGLQDPTFGNAGTTRIDGVVGFPGLDFSRIRIRAALQSDGKIVLAYSVNLNAGTAVAVGRLDANGVPDTTFTTDQRFDSLFSLAGVDTASNIVRLPDGRLLVAGTSGNRGLFLRLKGEQSTTPLAQNVVEFYNTALRHYFITASANEATAIDHGSAGAGWQRTGIGFLAWTPAGAVPDAARPVCRFYGTPGRGPNSHFYTANNSECAAVKNDPGWTYEGIAFYVLSPNGEQCPGNLQPVYRAYNNRFAQNDSNHRYAVDVSALQPLVSQGWTIEGVVFCVPTK